jgi:hypothetical protein
MKRKTSKEILVESFREVAESKNIDKMTEMCIRLYILGTVQII